jgi:zinc finger BED domain-containing protein 5/7/8/9
LTRLFALRNEVYLFLSSQKSTRKRTYHEANDDTECDVDENTTSEKPKKAHKYSVEDMKEFFGSENFLTMLAYLCDIFSRLNELNLSIQGKKASIFDSHSKIVSMKRKLNFYALKIKEDDLTSFPTLAVYVGSSNSSLSPELKRIFIAHVTKMKEEFDRYFPEENINHTWVLNPFQYDETNLPEELSTAAQEELLTLSSNLTIKSKFQFMGYQEFWLEADLDQEFPVLQQIAITMLLKFPTTYLCEKGFSAMLYLKNKYRSKLNVEDDLRIKLSNIVPDFPLIMKKQTNCEN